MAGSYWHCVESHINQKLVDNETLNGMLENGGDVYEAVEEMYGMIWYLAAGDIEKVETAQKRYKIGLAVSPSGDEHITRPE